MTANAHFVLMILAVLCFLLSALAYGWARPEPYPRAHALIAAGLFFWAFAVLIA